MKGFSRSDSLTSLLYPSLQEEVSLNHNAKENNSGVYSREFQAVLESLEGEDGIINDEIINGGQSGDKKKRLTIHQVKSLEKIFEVGNKLDPERKLKLAQDLGLQPRQVAIWFQNRRARWKTKQLERDYNLLKSNYDALKLNFHKLEEDKQSLTKELMELKAKVPEEKTKSREKSMFMEEAPKKRKNNDSSPLIEARGEPTKTNHLKDGSSDSSDSSVVLNEDRSTNLINNVQFLIPQPPPPPPTLDFSWLSYNTSSHHGFWDLRTHHQQEMVKMELEEQQFLVSRSSTNDPNSEESSCNIFSVDQAPTLCWYFPDHTNN